MWGGTSIGTPPGPSGPPPGPPGPPPGPPEAYKKATSKLQKSKNHPKNNKLLYLNNPEREHLVIKLGACIAVGACIMEEGCKDKKTIKQYSNRMCLSSSRCLYTIREMQ